MEETIGFDLRSIVPDASWTAERRTRHLLRRDVPAVRSVDTQVWERLPGLPRPPVPEGLWPSLSDLFAVAGALDRAGAVAVRITAFMEDEPAPDNPDPAGPAESSDFLGYDVADYWMLSGLTNCGYKPEEAASLAPVWVPRLNDWHLFHDPDDAETFAEVMDKRVPEHAPFYAFGIYQLR
jgi:hypothetical protein